MVTRHQSQDSEPEVRGSMMTMLLDRLFQAYARLNIVKKYHRELNYFFAFRAQLGIDARCRQDV